MKILITGCNGQLGNELRLQIPRHPNHEFFLSDIVEQEGIYSLDITDVQAVKTFTDEKHIDLIVNCAAYVNVDKAEDNEDITLKINADAVANLVHTGCKILHISTDYVFEGNGHYPYNEEDTPHPTTAYGRTKWAGEKVLTGTNAVILRTAWLYSSFGNNFVKTMLRLGQEKKELGVVFDQIGTPTYARDLATAIFTVIEAPQWCPGVYHLTDEGVCSWYDFTHEIFKIYNTLRPKTPITTLLKPIHSSEYQYRTPRPPYSVLDKSKFKETFGVTIPHWTEALYDCMVTLL